MFTTDNRAKLAGQVLPLTENVGLRITSYVGEPGKKAANGEFIDETVCKRVKYQ